MILKSKVYFSFIGIGIFLNGFSTGFASVSLEKEMLQPSVRFRLSLGSEEAELKDYPLVELFRKAGLKSFEQLNPLTRNVVLWKGALLSQLVERSIQSLPLEQKTRIDLLRVETKGGRFVDIPRALVVKYPILLGYLMTPENKEPSDPRAITVVIPWSTHPKILQEGLPLEDFWISPVQSISLTSYNDQFKFYFLKRRTDPTAIRGEKLFLRNFVSDFVGSRRVLLSSEDFKPLEKLKRPFTAKEQHSLERYIHLFNEENKSILSPRT